MMCNICKREFVKNVHNQKYCSSKCNSKAYYLRGGKDKMKEYAKRPSFIKYQKEYNASERRKEVALKYERSEKGIAKLKRYRATEKGKMTRDKARELFKDGIERKDKNFLREIYVSALNNNLDAEKLFKQARTSIKSDITFEFKKDAYKIIDRLQLLGGERGGQELQRMREAGELSPELEKQLMKIL